MSDKPAKKNHAKPYGANHGLKKNSDEESNYKQFRASTIAKCKQYSPEWWDVVSKWLTQETDNEFKKLAVVEFNKLQIKALPSDIKVGSDGSIDVGVVVLPARTVHAPVAIPEKNDYKPLFASPDTVVASEGEIIE